MRCPTGPGLDDHEFVQINLYKMKNSDLYAISVSDPTTSEDSETDGDNSPPHAAARQEAHEPNSKSASSNTSPPSTPQHAASIGPTGRDQVHAAETRPLALLPKAETPPEYDTTGPYSQPYVVADMCFRIKYRHRGTVQQCIESCEEWLPQLSKWQVHSDITGRRKREFKPCLDFLYEGSSRKPHSASDDQRFRLWNAPRSCSALREDQRFRLPSALHSCSALREPVRHVPDDEVIEIPPPPLPSAEVMRLGHQCTPLAARRLPRKCEEQRAAQSATPSPGHRGMSQLDIDKPSLKPSSTADLKATFHRDLQVIKRRLAARSDMQTGAAVARLVLGYVFSNVSAHAWRHCYQ